MKDKELPGSQTIYGLPIGFTGERGTVLHLGQSGGLTNFGYGDEGLSRMDKVIENLWPNPEDQSGEPHVS